MAPQKVVIFVTIVIIALFLVEQQTWAMSKDERKALKEQVLEMFYHAYGAYMENAYPADELMPLSCKGRYRGTEPNRGDVDDSLGNFTLTLVDTLDTLAVLGDVPEFERAVRLIIKNTRFDSDIVVSVFETNIRVLGGLLGGHVVASFLKRKRLAMGWYSDELLNMAKDVGYRLLPAFNTTTGIPFPRVNLKKGIDPELFKNYKDTCTACAGTMILEFAALSRLSGDPIFEEKAHKAMDYLWEQRHRTSDLVGTVINIHNGDWVRRESGVGAGIDSYYEYVLKAYILLGDDTYLDRFNKHYEAIMKYVSQGPLMVDVHMHRPQTVSRHFMDALLAFWPGLQVLKGDIQPAIEIHEMLYQVMRRHNFLPEAFTTDFRVHWGQHPLRPEFVESTYFLYKATGDPYYLEVGKQVIENLNSHARVECGFAAIKDVTRGTHEDQLDSFVLAETFKYLYLLYADKSDLIFDVDDYIFTTEAHLLPLYLSVYNNTKKTTKTLSREDFDSLDLEDEEGIGMSAEFVESDQNTCPNPQYKYRSSMNYAQNLRSHLKDIVEKSSPAQTIERAHPRLKAVEFIAGNKDQLLQLQNMGIRIQTMTDGRVQLLHTAAEAISPEAAEDGLKFMQEMIDLSKQQAQNIQQQHEPMNIQFVSAPYFGTKSYKAGPAQFGYNLKTKPPVSGRLVVAVPYKACGAIENVKEVQGKIAIIQRGDCMFIDKGRNLQRAGALGAIVIDHTPGSTSLDQPMFAMSGDGTNDVSIPMVFLFDKEGQEVIKAQQEDPKLAVFLTYELFSKDKFQSKSSPTVSVDAAFQFGVEGPDKSNAEPSSTQSAGQSPDVDTGKWTQHETPKKVREFKLQPLKPIEDYDQFDMSTGTNTVTLDLKIKSPVSEPGPPSVTDNDVIQLTTMSDGSKQLSFRFDQLQAVDYTQKPKLSDIYTALVDVLYDRTNIRDLKRQSEYLTTIEKLLKAAYFGMENADKESQLLFDQLAEEIEILKKDETDARGIDLSDKQKYHVLSTEMDQSSKEQEEEELELPPLPDVPIVEEEKDAVTEHYMKVNGHNVKVRIHMKGKNDVDIGSSRSYAIEQDFSESPVEEVKTVSDTEINKKSNTYNIDAISKVDDKSESIRESLDQSLAFLSDVENVDDESIQNTLQEANTIAENILRETLTGADGKTIQDALEQASKIAEEMIREALKESKLKIEKDGEKLGKGIGKVEKDGEREGEKDEENENDSNSENVEEALEVSAQMIKDSMIKHTQEDGIDQSETHFIDTIFGEEFSDIKSEDLTDTKSAGQAGVKGNEFVDPSSEWSDSAKDSPDVTHFKSVEEPVDGQTKSDRTSSNIHVEQTAEARKDGKLFTQGSSDATHNEQKTSGSESSNEARQSQNKELP